MRSLRGPATALALLAVALALAVPPAAGQASTVAASDSTTGKPLVTLNALLGFLDADGDVRAEAALPEEPIYLDLDGSKTVTYGDLRLTPFLHYPAASTVDVGNSDLGSPLAQTSGWFAVSAQGAWYADLDSSNSASAGDARLSGAFGSRVQPDSPDLRTELQAAQPFTQPGQRVGYVDLDNDRAKDADEPVYLDLEQSGREGFGQATVGDLRLTPGAPGVDDAPTRAEFEAALEQAGVESGEDGGFERAEGSSGGGWGTPEVILLLLGLLNLAGLGFLYSRSRRGPPRNPFK